MRPTDQLEWLEADGLGGFASGTATGVRTRRYHGLLLAAAAPPGGRMMLVNGFDAWVTTAAGRYAISSQRYTPDVVFPDGIERLEHFEHVPWPRWVFRLEDGTSIEQSVCVVHGTPTVTVSWRLLSGAAATLDVRPFFSGRDYHATHHENGAIQLHAGIDADGALTFNLYEGVPAVHVASNGHYEPSPVWYRNFVYTAERERGLDAAEDLASPGTFSWDLAGGDAHLVLSTFAVPARTAVAAEVTAMRTRERARRQAFSSPLAAAADAYIVARASGRTIVAGYPWFTDWGRDTFVSLPGLCLETGRLEAARSILLEWAGTVSDGMLPNRFPDYGDTPEFNAVDASLWFIIAVARFLDEASRRGYRVTRADRNRLDDAVLHIVSGYRDGTRHGIQADDDGLLAAGERGVQLTWMDARVNGREVTPRIGKPVEVQALWINALAIAAGRDATWASLQRRAQASFDERFWNDARGCLFDVVDVDHARGATDASLRPNQILAVGGLPLPILTGPRAAAVTDLVERELLTPLGLRTLAPGERGYIGTYGGGVEARDGAYHQGTAWPWLLYPFADACVRTRPAGRAARDVARIVDALRAHLSEAGLGHVSEVASGDPPHAPGGCPFQAWSLGALIQLQALLGRLANPTTPRARSREPGA